MRNVVLIVCDQLRPDFLHAYGADFIPTPHIDALAADGCVFERAFTASTVCAPARASMFTGLPVSAHGAWTNQIPVKDGIRYLPERLNDLGYHTAAVGCYDHAPKGNTIGYQYLKTLINGRDNEHLDQLKKRHPEAVTSYAADGLSFKYTEEEHYDRWSCDQAVDYLKRPHDKPFFLYCGFLMPHGPYLPPKEVKGRVDPDKIPDFWPQTRDDIPAVEQYRHAFVNPKELLDTESDPEATRKAMEQRKAERVAYCEMICEIDDLVGRLVTQLKESGLYENTTILFTADHGSMENDLGVNTKGPWPYTPQLFIPMILANAPGLAPGSRSDILCGNLDVGATVLDLAGSHEPFGLSRSMIGMTNGSVPEREVGFSEFCDSVKTVISKQYTFSYYPFTGKCTLFDRDKDPRFSIDLAKDPEYAPIVQSFLMRVIDFMTLCKGVRIETHDLAPEIKKGIEAYDPSFMDSFEICYPLGSPAEVESVRAAGLDADYNEFTKTHPIKAHYGVYWQKRDY